MQLIDAKQITDDEWRLIQDALRYRFCFLESGQCHLSYDDIKKMDDKERRRQGVRLPTREQLEGASEVRKLWEKVMHRRFR
jgi:hypothetical protein